MSLDNVVSAGSSALEAFVLMQQARIDALESDFALMSTELRTVTAKQTASDLSTLHSNAAPPLPPPTHAPAMLEPAVPAAVVNPMPLPPWMQQAPRRRLRYEAEESCKAASSFILGVSLVVGIPACFFLLLGILVYFMQNTATYAEVTYVVAEIPLGRWQPVCNTILTWVSHDNVTRNNTVMLDATAGACDQIRVGSDIAACYCWSYPSNFDVDFLGNGCGLNLTYAQGVFCFVVGLCVAALIYVLWVGLAIGTYVFVEAALSQKPWWYGLLPSSDVHE